MEEKGTDTDPGKLCQRGQFWKKILREIPEREGVGVNGKELPIKQCETQKLTILFLGQKKAEVCLICHKSNGEDGEGEECQ